MSQGWGQPPQSPPPGSYGQPPAGVPQQGFGPPQQSASASGMAIAAMVLGIAAWVVAGPVCAIPGAIIGKMELNKIARGESAEAGKVFAQVGFWTSIINIVVYTIGCVVFCLIYVFAFGMFFATAPSQQY
jgi:hypothetical protein